MPKGPKLIPRTSRIESNVILHQTWHSKVDYAVKIFIQACLSIILTEVKLDQIKMTNCTNS